MTGFAEFNVILRSDLNAFVHHVFKTVSPNDTFKNNWHIEAITHELMRCHARENKRLIITQPPRSLKSICTSVAFVAWALGHDPTLRFLCVSYSEGLANDLARQFRMVVESDWYRRMFPRMRPKKETKTECITTKGGGRVALSVGGSVTGEHGIGVEKTEALKLMFNETDLAAQRQVKHVFDPTGRANPNKIFTGPEQANE